MGYSLNARKDPETGEIQYRVWDPVAGMYCEEDDEDRLGKGEDIDVVRRFIRNEVLIQALDMFEAQWPLMVERAAATGSSQRGAGPGLEAPWLDDSEDHGGDVDGEVAPDS